jgi:hypothetical protein
LGDGLEYGMIAAIYPPIRFCSSSLGMHIGHFGQNICSDEPAIPPPIDPISRIGSLPILMISGVNRAMISKARMASFSHLD